MAFAIAGLFATGSTIIEDTACVRTSYPQFESVLMHIQRGDNTLWKPASVISSMSDRRSKILDR
jgi:3-phosphoshikimate 1-carboxyvinyltransferase